MLIRWVHWYSELARLYEKSPVILSILIYFYMWIIMVTTMPKPWKHKPRHVFHCYINKLSIIEYIPTTYSSVCFYSTLFLRTCQISMDPLVVFHGFITCTNRHAAKITIQLASESNHLYLTMFCLNNFNCNLFVKWQLATLWLVGNPVQVFVALTKLAKMFLKQWIFS